MGISAAFQGVSGQFMRFQGVLEEVTGVSKGVPEAFQGVPGRIKTFQRVSEKVEKD